MARYDRNDIVGGLLVVALGLFFFVKSIDYGIGAANRMLPGYFPLMVSSIVIVLGVAVAIKGFLGPKNRIEIAWRPLIFVPLGLVAFIFVMRWFGLLPAIAATVAVSALATSESRRLSTFVLAIVVCVLIWLIFSVGLRLPIALFKGF
ncbi:MAG: tripartite tricarboxylate transporter TctB family protein [Salinarimonadaceae bacterium]|nr:MAG: tripartite tricarboxylate transporter TctB family protein [Salinarimonadaceae bacterium]